MTQLERLKQEIKALLAEIDTLQRQNNLQDHDLNDSRLLTVVTMSFLLVSNAAWMFTFFGLGGVK